jgi:hypothetical protein
MERWARGAGTAAAFALSLAWLAFNGSSAAAHQPHPGLKFWIAIDGVPNCSTQARNASCTLEPGSVFAVGLHLGPLPQDIPSYQGFDAALKYTGVTAQEDASASAWPDCGFPARSYGQPNIVLLACTIGVPPARPSTYSGLIATNSFTCSQSGNVSLMHGRDNTDLLQTIDQIHAEDPRTTDTLTIKCVAGGVTPIPTTPQAARGATSLPPDTPLPPTEQARAVATSNAYATYAAQAVSGSGQGAHKSGGGLGAGVIAIIAVAAATVASGAGFFGWRYLQGRGGAGGGRA